MIFEPHQGTTARLFGGLFLCQFLAVACFSGLSKIAYFRLILESGIKRETVRNFSPRYNLLKVNHRRDTSRIETQNLNSESTMTAIMTTGITPSRTRSSALLSSP